MNCPHCVSAATTRRQGRTTLGYRRFNCRSCKRRLNERTGTPFNHLQVPTDVVLLAVLWRLRYKLSFRDVAEMLLQRGVEVTHETIREWEFRFAPLLAGQLRAKRRRRRAAQRRIDGRGSRPHRGAVGTVGTATYSGSASVVLPENIVRPNVTRRDARTRDAARPGSADPRLGPRSGAVTVAAGRPEPTVRAPGAVARGCSARRTPAAPVAGDAHSRSSDGRDIRA